ncbi:hypothetical protein OG394_30590 [Kribbella sp. NBC_01245]|uniref:hypothetical protein n=1 Tax=Kribbella sp. NBC_01245 TaxID=2903578 RepID=UPI002E2D9DCE|nr:hypothetical protein [Kribbella sp. NBC_01245]
MPKRLVLVGAAVLIAVAATVWLVLPSGGGVGRELAGGGDALETEGNGHRIGFRSAKTGEEIYFLSPAPVNLGDRDIVFKSAALATVPAGIEFVDARVYRRSEFDAVPINWSSSMGSPGSDPRRKRSSSIEGVELKAGQTMDDVVLVHVRVIGSQRPLEMSGIRYTYKYRDGDKEWQQVVPVDLSIKG